MDWYVLQKSRQKSPVYEQKARELNKPGRHIADFSHTSRRRKRISVIIAAFLLVGILFFAGYTWANKKVTLSFDGKTLEVNTFASTVEDVLKAQGIVLGVKDKVTPSSDSSIKDGMKIVVERAVPINIKVDGEIIRALSLRETVAGVLEEYDIALGPDDIVKPDRQAALERNMSVQITRVKKETQTEEVEIPYAVKRKESSSMLKGESKVISPGRNGIERQYWEVTYHDGEEVERELMRREVVKQPVDRVVLIGTKQTVSRGGETIRFSRTLNMLATGYTHTGNPTASGIMPKVGVVAADTSIIPMKTRLYIEGYGHATVLDRGSAIKGNRIDLFFNTKEEALKWGRRWVKVYVLTD